MRCVKRVLLPLLFLLLIKADFISAQVITTVAGLGIPGFSGDGGSAINAQFNNPISVALDAAGNLYVADLYNNRIRKIMISTGVMTTIAGDGTAGFSGDGGPALTATMNNPGDICVDPSGNIYFMDNQNFRIRKIDPVTGIITTVVGNGQANYAGETTTATNAGIYYPGGIAVDATHLYFSLTAHPRICKVNLATGIISTIGGTGVAGFSGDGGSATSANFNFPTGMAVSTTGEVYVADYLNNRIRKISSTGIVTTVAGNGTAAFAGDGGQATIASINLPTGVSVDPAGNIFIADRNNYRIRKVTAASGVITTVAGSGNYGYGGDGGSAISPCVKMADPHKVRSDAAGNLYISDQSNARIRKVDNSPVNNVTPTIAIATSSTTVCEGSPVLFNAAITNASSPAYQWKVNGVNTGTGTSAFSTSSLQNGDVVICELTSTTGCGTVTVASNGITITVTPAINAAVNITSNATSICEGSDVSFMATPQNGGANPSYQWQINGVSTGSAGKTFTDNNFKNGDIVSCILTSTINCASPSPAISNVIAITVDPIVTPAVTITADVTSICNGGTILFNASTTNAGNNPDYRWQINDVTAGTNNSAFSGSSFQNGDIVNCIIVPDPSLVCYNSASTISNEITVTVLATPAPSVSIVSSANNICPGTPVQFIASVQNAGSGFSYQWKLNGTTTGTNNAVYNNNDLANGDRVECVVSAPNANCPSAFVLSNPIITTVRNAPVIAIDPVNPTAKAGEQVKLTATVTGSVDSYQWSPANKLQNANSLSPITKPLDETTTFVLEVTNNEGCSDTKQVTVKIYRPLFMPTAFTPDNNGVNDVYRIPPDVFLALDHFSIYDRWGNRIFYTSDIAKGWDGRYKGVPLATGAFVYTISGTLEGKKTFLKGIFTLTR